jgi:hypothetical protein
MSLRFVNPRMPRFVRDEEESYFELEPGQGALLGKCEALYGEAIESGLEIWDVEVDGKPRYVAFLYMADSGTVFDRATSAVVAQRIQTYFGETNDKPLAEALNDGYRVARKEFAKALKAGSTLTGSWAAYQDMLDQSSPKKKAKKKARPKKKVSPKKKAPPKKRKSSPKKKRS